MTSNWTEPASFTEETRQLVLVDTAHLDGIHEVEDTATAGGQAIWARQFRNRFPRKSLRYRKLKRSSIRPYKNVIDYQLLPYHRYGESKYGFLGRVYELEDFTPSSAETLARLRAIIEEAFGRSPTAPAELVAH